MRLPSGDQTGSVFWPGSNVNVLAVSRAMSNSQMLAFRPSLRQNAMNF